VSTAHQGSRPIRFAAVGLDHAHAFGQIEGLPSRSLIGLAIENNEYAGGNPIDHCRTSYDRGHGGDQIGNDVRRAGQKRNTHEARAAEKRDSASAARSPHLVPG
jgi:hypothetical protein